MESTRVPITEVVSGGASGVDKLGEQFALLKGLPCRVFPADWDKFGKIAGKLRNIEMADYADFVIALWDGMSPGTAHMIATGCAKGKPAIVFTVTKKEPEIADQSI
jgi:hypothetical protein